MFCDMLGGYLDFEEAWTAEHECAGGMRPRFVDLPAEVVDDEKIHSIYRRCVIRARTPDVCIDPRLFYDSKDVADDVKVVKEERRDVSQAKPVLSYAQIITQALETSSTGRLTLSEIYAWIEHAFEYYRHANPVWKNSIRHNLSLNKCFRKVPRDPGTRGKGGRWAIDHEFLMREEKRRRRMCRDDLSESSKTCESMDGSLSEDMDELPAFSMVGSLVVPKNVNKV